MAKFLSISEKGLFISLLVLIVVIPLLPKFPLFGVKGTFAAIRSEDMLLALVYGWWTLYLILSGKIKFLLTEKINQSFLLFFFIGAVSLFSAVFLTQTALPHLGFLHYLRRIEVMLLLPFAFFAVKDLKQLKIILITFVVVTLLVNIYALGQQYLGWPVISTTNSEFSKGIILRLTEGARVNSTFAGHYDLAIFLMMVLTVSSALFFALKSLRIKAGIVFLGSLSFLVLVMTAARLSFVAAIAGIIASFIFVGKKILVAAMFILVCLALIYPSQLRDRFISTVTINILGQGERYESANSTERYQLNIPTLPRGASTPSASSTSSAQIATPSAKVASDIAPGEPVDATQLGVYRSFQIRLNVEWPKALRAFEKNPLLGTGYSSLGLASDNDVLRSLGEVGILGTISFSLIIIEIVKRVRKNFTQADSKFLKFLSAGTLSLILAFILNSLVIDVFEASKVASLFWMFLGISLSIEKFR